MAEGSSRGLGDPSSLFSWLCSRLRDATGLRGTSHLWCTSPACNRHSINVRGEYARVRVVSGLPGRRSQTGLGLENRTENGNLRNPNPESRGSRSLEQPPTSRKPRFKPWTHWLAHRRNYT